MAFIQRHLIFFHFLSFPSCPLFSLMPILVFAKYLSDLPPFIPSQPILLIQSQMPNPTNQQLSFRDYYHSYRSFQKALSGSSPSTPRLSPIICQKINLWVQNLSEHTAIWVVWIMPAAYLINFRSSKLSYAMPCFMDI